jgi:hypothetical protein
MAPKIMNYALILASTMDAVQHTQQYTHATPAQQHIITAQVITFLRDSYPYGTQDGMWDTFAEVATALLENMDVLQHDLPVGVDCTPLDAYISRGGAIHRALHVAHSSMGAPFMVDTHGKTHMSAPVVRALGARNKRILARETIAGAVHTQRAILAHMASLSSSQGIVHDGHQQLQPAPQKGISDMNHPLAHTPLTPICYVHGHWDSAGSAHDLYSITWYQRAILEHHFDHRGVGMPVSFYAYRAQTTRGDVDAALRAQAVQHALGGCFLPPNYNGPVTATLALVTQGAFCNVDMLCSMPGTTGPPKRQCTRRLAHYTAWPLRTITVANQAILTHTPTMLGIPTEHGARNQSNTHYILIMKPIATGHGKLIGGLPGNAEPGVEPALSPAISTMTAIKPSLQHVVVPDNHATVIAKEIADIEVAPTALFQRQGHSINLQGRVMLVDKNMRVSEEHRTGQSMKPLGVGTCPKVKWLSSANNSGVLPALAPVFAPLASVWMDRTLVSTLTTAISWTGVARSPEIDPQARSALRAAAAAPIELTRYYVRLWAMALDCAAANAASETYHPRTRHGWRHVLTGIDNFSTWSPLLVGTVFGGNSTLFFDAYTLSETTDLIPVLALAAAPGLTGSTICSWLWPDIEKSLFCTNAVRPTIDHDGICYETILAAISWLSDSTATETQSAEARNFVLQMAYRPQGWGLYGNCLQSTTTAIMLPKARTAGQFISPYCLYATTVGSATSTAATPLERVQLLRAAAVAGSEFVYSIHKAAVTLQPQRWWDPATQAIHHARHSSLHKMSANGWIPAITAASIRHQHGFAVKSVHSTRMWPMARDGLARLSRSGTTNSLDIIAWNQQLLGNDGATPLFAKVCVDTEHSMITCGTPMRLAAAIGSSDPILAASVLAAAGVKCGYMLVNRATNTVNSSHWAPAGHVLNADANPKHTVSWQTATPVVQFDDPLQVLAVAALARARSECQWYHSVNYISADSDLVPASAPPQGTPHPSSQAMHASSQQAVAPTSSPGSDGEQPDEHNATTAAGEPDDLTTMPPERLTKAGDPDELLSTLVNNALNPGTRSLRLSMATLRDWTIPQRWAGDNEVLSWAADNITAAVGAKQADDPYGCAQHVQHMLMEQMRLNSLRETTAIVNRFLSSEQESKNSEDATPNTGQGPRPPAQMAVDNPALPNPTPPQHGIAKEAGAPNSASTSKSTPLKPGIQSSSTTAHALNADDIPTLAVTTSV